MTACVGWQGDSVCPVYGPLHGCKHPDGHHTPKDHECECGVRARAWTARVGRGLVNRSGRSQPIYRLTDRREDVA